MIIGIALTVIAALAAAQSAWEDWDTLGELLPRNDSVLFTVL